jgi:hypothetical protein
MKKIIMLALCLCLTSNMSFSQTTLLTNNWNNLTKVSNQIIDIKTNAGDGIYVIEKDIYQVPYIQGGDTLYGTRDSSMFFRKVSFNGNQIWTKTFPKQQTFDSTIGQPFQIHMVSNGIVLFCDWGIRKYDFAGTLVFTTLFPQSSFDFYGFAGGGPSIDYFFLHKFFGCAQPVVEFSPDTLCVLGKLGRSGDTSYIDSSTIFTMIDPSGNIIGERVINRGTSMGVTYDATTKLFYCVSITDSVRIETMNIRTGQTTEIFSLPLWGTDKEIIHFFKTNSGFAMITREVNMTTNRIQLIALYPGQNASMTGSMYYQQLPNMKPVLDEFVSCERNGDVFYITAEDGELIRWGIGPTANSATLQVRNPFLQGEKIYGSPRIVLLGSKLAYVTNDSITTINDTIIGPYHYFTTVKASVIRIFSQNGLWELAKDTLADYAINQFDLTAIDSLNFCFGGWLGQSASAVVSKWSLDQQITTGMSTESFPKDDVQVYPNPTSDYITLSVDPTLQYELTIRDVSGIVVLRQVYQGQLNVSNFRKGMYFISIRCGSTTTNKKLIIQ